MLPSGSWNTLEDDSPVSWKEPVSLVAPAVEVAPVSLIADGIRPSNTPFLIRDFGDFVSHHDL